MFEGLRMFKVDLWIKHSVWVFQTFRMLLPIFFFWGGGTLVLYTWELPWGLAAWCWWHRERSKSEMTALCWEDWSRWFCQTAHTSSKEQNDKDIVQYNVIQCNIRYDTFLYLTIRTMLYSNDYTALYIYTIPYEINAVNAMQYGIHFALHIY